MLIVCTQDPVIRDTAASPAKGGPAWAPVELLPLGGQVAADIAFAEALRELPAGQALCLSAHGNDREIGDAEDEWTWTAADVAALLHENVAANWTGPILIHACAKNVSNFSARLARALGEIAAFPGRWCYGYNRPVPSDARFPPPVGLERRVDLQGTQV